MLKKALFIPLLVIAAQGCLDDNLFVPEVQELTNSAVFLTYLEEQGDYINALGFPSIIDAQQVYENLDETYVIDIRPSNLFANGHIQGAVNLNPEQLIQVIEEMNRSVYSQIVIVSETGQRASYFTSLMRMYGFNDVYSLRCGMALWHSDFSYAIADHLVEDDPFYNKMATNILFIPEEYYPFPKVVVNTDSDQPEDKLKARIEDLLQYDILLGEGKFRNEISTSKWKYFDYYYVPDSSVFDVYTVAFAFSGNYQTGRNESGGHFFFAYWYRPTNGGLSDMRSNARLQTIPNNLPVVVYSPSGQFSAYIVAYLQLLGYDARTLVYGSQAFFYQNSRKFYYSFRYDDVKDYPYQTGN